MFAEHSAGRRNLGEDPVVVFIKHIVLRSIFKATFMYTNPFLDVSNSPTKLAPSELSGTSSNQRTPGTEIQRDCEIK